MAHFVQLDANNIVTTGIVVSNDVISNLPFPESEAIGVAFCQSLYGSDTVWAQTSYNANFRFNYAGGAGYKFDPTVSTHGAFIPPQPYPSWVLNTDTYRWSAPVPHPVDGNIYRWDEQTETWIEVQST